MANGPVRPGLRIFPGTKQSLDAVFCAAFAKRGGRRNARHGPPHGQTIGAILAAISFRIAGHSETTALSAAAALAGVAAIASAARLYHPAGARPVKLSIVPDAP